MESAAGESAVPGSPRTNDFIISRQTGGEAAGLQSSFLNSQLFLNGIINKNHSMPKKEDPMFTKTLDETDKKIINELKKNSRISMTELGKKVFLTGQAAKNRIERLQDLGVVEQYTVNVNCLVFGYTVHGLFILHPEKRRKRISTVSFTPRSTIFSTATKRRKQSSLTPISTVKNPGVPSRKCSLHSAAAPCIRCSGKSTASTRWMSNRGVEI